MISAKIIADSISQSGVRLTTLQLKYPRFIHSEMMTHRVFSRNASSSRAIPASKMIEAVRSGPAMPIHWGKNQPGMQAKGEVKDKWQAQKHWMHASDMVARYAEVLSKLNVHKQVVNRLTEPFQHISVLVTATEWDNFFKLRLHPDAQPEIQKLARVMKAAMDESDPTPLQPDEWHLPYIREQDITMGQVGEGKPFCVNLEDLKLISAARCARVSYLNHDQSEPDIGKDLALAERLAESGHWSPFEHQGTPINLSTAAYSYPGVTHVFAKGNKYKPTDLWSGNFRGWIQNRQILDV